MPTHKPMKKDAVLEKAIAGYTKDPRYIDVFSAKDKVYQKKVNEGLHDNKPSSTIQVNDEEVDTLLNVSQVQDQEFVSQSFGPKYRIALEKEKVVLLKANDPILEKAIKGYTKDTTKMDVFTAEDKVYAQQVNWSLSHNVGPSELKKGTPEQAPTAGPKVDDLLNVASKQDQEFISLGFGAKSRQ